jgi:type I restriction enzyme S subunit
MEKQLNLPDIRFPEFVNEWESKKLGNLFFNRRQKGNINLPIFSVTQDRGLVPRNSLDRNMGNDAQPGDNLLVYPNDLVYNMMRMWQGAIGIAHQKCMVSPAYVVLQPLDKVDPVFFINYFQRSRSTYLFTAFSYGITSDRLRLYYKDFSEIVLFTPTLPEQIKIACFLTAVDDRLNQLKKKKSLLEQYKNGVMQKIFDQEIRFKDDEGQEFPKWQSKTLGEIGVFQTSSIDKLYDPLQKKVFLVNYMNVYRHENITNATKENLMIVTAKDSQIATNNLMRGDILFTPSSETPEDIGHSVVIFEDLENCVYSYHLMRFRPIVEINILYSHYFCNIPKVLNQLTKLSSGSTRFTISVKSFSSISVDLPCLQEQNKIANFLSAIDEKISLCNTQIIKTEQYKKGLLQQLFC